MEYLGSNKEILLVGLNPTEQALKHGAVFCQTNGLWRILSNSTLMPRNLDIDSIPLFGEKDGKYRNYASHFFGDKTNLGFLDLVPDVYAKKGSTVKITQQHLDNFYAKLASTKVKKVGLLGKKVTIALFPEIKNSLSYGKLNQTISIGKSQVEVFCLPFPETVPMKTEQKAQFYNLNNIQNAYQ